MKKLLLLFLLLSAGISSVYAAPKKLYFDRFDLPLRRTVWLKYPVSAEDWTIENKIEFCGVRSLIRFFGNPEDITDFKVINADNKIIMQTKKIKKIDWVNFHGPFPYTVKVSGKANAKKSINIAFDAHDNEDKSLPGWKSVQMLSWSVWNCTAAAADGGGVELTTKNDKFGRLRTSIYDRSVKKKYQASITAVSENAQQVTFSASWKGGKKEIKLDLQPGKPQVLTVDFQPKSADINVQIYFNGKIRLTKFDFMELN